MGIVSSCPKSNIYLKYFLYSSSKEASDPVRTCKYWNLSRRREPSNYVHSEIRFSATLTISQIRSKFTITSSQSRSAHSERDLDSEWLGAETGQNDDLHLSLLPVLPPDVRLDVRDPPLLGRVSPPVLLYPEVTSSECDHMYNMTNKSHQEPRWVQAELHREQQQHLPPCRHLYLPQCAG